MRREVDDELVLIVLSRIPSHGPCGLFWPRQCHPPPSVVVSPRTGSKRNVFTSIFTQMFSFREYIFVTVIVSIQTVSDWSNMDVLQLEL